MSMQLHVFFAAARMPDIGQWQALIDSRGFGVRLDPETKVATDTGFLPAKLNECVSGFEFDIGRALDVLDGYPDIAQRVAGLDAVGNFRWGGDLNEMACALAAAAGLAAVTDGIWFDPQEGDCRDAQGAIREAEAGIAAACE